MRLWLAIVFSLFFLILGCHSRQKKDSFEKKLSTIPIVDQQKLEILFHYMMTGDYFACTLFGNKPMTFQEFFEDPWKLPSAGMANPYCFFYLEEGWKIWLKYRNLFSSNRFIFSKIPSKVGYEFIILINKPAFKKIFNENHDLFKKVLGSRITVEEIFRDFEEGEKNFSKVLNEHEGLIGLVLGYGRTASMHVYHNGVLKHQIIRNTFYPLSPPMEDNRLPRKILTSIKLQEKKLYLRGIKWHQLPHNENEQDLYSELCKCGKKCEFLFPSWQECIFHILPPNFTVVKGSIEAEKLKKEYTASTQIARKAFKQNSFLRVFLEEYCK